MSTSNLYKKEILELIDSCRTLKRQLIFMKNADVDCKDYNKLCKALESVCSEIETFTTNQTANK